MSGAPHPSLRHVALITLALASAYVVMGRLGLLLAIPPGYATAIWPPAGLALAAGLALGRRAAPGIFLGSFILNLWISDLSHLGSSRAAVMAACIALASTLQALVAGSLIRRVVGYPSPLDQGRDILAFFALGGPLACWIAPTLGVLVLVLVGGMPWGAFLPNWFTWWAGDTLGAMAFAPLGLAMMGEPRAVWVKRRVTLGIPLVLAFLAVVLVFVQVRTLGRERARNTLNTQATSLTDRLMRTLEQHQQLLRGLQAFCQVSGEPERKAFQRYAHHVHNGEPAIPMLEWAPIVAGTARDAFEARIRKVEYPDFRIHTRTGGQAPLPAPRADMHVPLLFIEPLLENREVLGLDLYNQPKRQPILEAALATGALQASPPFRLPHDPTGSPCVSLSLPVRDTEGRPKGFVLVVINVDKLWDQSLGSAGAPEKGLRLRLMDTTEPQKPLNLLDVTERQGRWARNQEVPLPSDPDLVWTQHLPVSGRTWAFQVFPTPETMETFRSWESWATLAAGTFFCSLLGALLLATTARAHFIEQQVETQTQALRARELELSQATRLLDQSQSTAGVGGWELDLESEGLFWTEETYRLHGVTSRIFHPTLERALSFLAPGSLPAVEQAIRQAREDGEPWCLEVELLDGPHSRWVEFTGRADPPQGHPSRLYGAYQDITHRREADQLKNEFISIVSHELRTPLTALKGSLGLLRHVAATGDPVRIHEMLDIADRNNERLGALVGDLLDMEKVRSGKLTLERSILDLQVLVDRTVEETDTYAQRFNVALVNDVRTLSVHVHGDPQRIAQVLSNLLSNAAKFSPAGGRVRVGTYLMPRKRVRVMVQDEGPGIPPAFQSRLFEPFAQADSSDRRAKGGTGLGLSISKALIERMGGEIGFTTAEGQGTTFWFELPVTEI